MSYIIGNFASEQIRINHPPQSIQYDQEKKEPICREN